MSSKEFKQACIELELKGYRRINYCPRKRYAEYSMLGAIEIIGVKK